MKRIVIIDDDPGVQEAFAFVFSAETYEVISLRNGNVVLKNECPIPDLYILDKQLSGVDGLDVCRFIKKQPATSHIPVIMLSASPNIHVLARSAGADDTLEKPFSIKLLRLMVEKHINNFEQRGATF